MSPTTVTFITIESQTNGEEKAVFELSMEKPAK